MKIFVKQSIKHINNSWRETWDSSGFRIRFIITLILFFAAAKYCKEYIAIFNTRPGTLLNDPLLSLFKPVDFSVEIFIMFHAILVFAIISLLKHPKRLMIALQAYSLLMVFRTVSIYLIPLEAPVDMIFLRDPFASMYMHKNGLVVNDLFFSGHVSSSFLFYLVADGKRLKQLILTFTVLIATMILWQKVHYTVDVIFAPLFSLLSIKLMTFFNHKMDMVQTSTYIQSINYPALEKTEEKVDMQPVYDGSEDR